jgi:hypothetical protein
VHPKNGSTPRCTAKETAARCRNRRFGPPMALNPSNNPSTSQTALNPPRSHEPKPKADPAPGSPLLLHRSPLPLFTLQRAGLRTPLHCTIDSSSPTARGTAHSPPLHNSQSTACSARDCALPSAAQQPVHRLQIARLRTPLSCTAASPPPADCATAHPPPPHSSQSTACRLRDCAPPSAAQQPAQRLHFSFHGSSAPTARGFAHRTFLWLPASPFPSCPASGNRHAP